MGRGNANVGTLHPRLGRRTCRDNPSLRGRHERFHGLHKLIGDGDVGGLTDVTIRVRVKGDAIVGLPVGVVLPLQGITLS